MLLASVSGSFTSAVANHGVYAVFGLMAIDALFPAASELVMLYAGAVAAGVFPAANGVTLFGSRIGFGACAFVTLALAGTLGYLLRLSHRLGDRPVRRTAAARAARRVVPSLACAARPSRGVVRPLGADRSAGGPGTPVVRSFVWIAAGILEMPLARTPC